MPKKDTDKTSATIIVKRDGKPMMTPGKNPLALPTQALADAVAAEWQSQQKFNPQKMPLSLLAYTAIDRIAGQEANIVEVLLAYVDTDTLSYRAEMPAVQKAQKQKWDPVLKWAAAEFGAIWQTTTGVMPLTQPEALHTAIRDYLNTLDAMHLAACCILASGYSSLVLALAVMKGDLGATEAFHLSRVEEDTQAEQWGRDEEAQDRAERLGEDLTAAGRFLGLLEPA